MITRKGILILILVLTVLLAGCDTLPGGDVTQQTGNAVTDPVENTTTPDTTEPQPTEPPTADASGKDLVTGLYPEGHELLFSVLLPEEVDNPEDLPVLKWVILAHWDSIIDRIVPTENAVVAINQDLAARNMPFRIQLEFFSMKDFIILEDGTLYYDLINFPEVREALQDADLVSGLFFDTEELMTYLQPITEYVTVPSEYSLENAVPHQLYWTMTTVDGEIYGIPTQYCAPKVLGWDVDERVFLEYGLEIEDFYAQFWEMDEVFAQIYEQNGGNAFLYLPGNGVNYGAETDGYVPQILYAQLYYQFKQITSCFAIDYTGETPQLVNYLETDYIRKTQQAVARYYNAGYYTKSELKQYVEFGCVDAGFEYSHDYYWFNKCGEYAIPVSQAQFMRTSLPDYVSGISVNADQKEHTLTLLKLISEDLEFRKLMLFGVENEDYKVVNGCRVRLERNKTARRDYYCMDYLSPMADFCGFKRGEYASSPVVEEGTTELESYQKTLEGCTVWYPLNCNNFDLTGLEEELAAINAVLAVQLRSFHTMDQDTYEQMLADIRAAGGDKVLEELQMQFDAWVAENIQ